jgi:hypothetical protein
MTIDLDQLREQARRDWRALYPLRRKHLDEVRAALGELPEALFADARAAFGIARSVPAPVAARLYRDLYLDEPPPGDDVAIDVAIGRLRRGDAAPLAGLLRADAIGTWDLLRVWHEASTLAGAIDVVPWLTDGTQRWPAPMDPVPMRIAGGPRIEVVDRAAVSATLAAQLEQPIGPAPHGTAAFASWRALGAGALPAERVDPTAAVLAHHGDGPLGEHEGRRQVNAADAARAAADLAPACEPLGDARLVPHLRAGLASPSRPRRLLSFCLLRRDGLAEGHPDDLMPRG